LLAIEHHSYNYSVYDTVRAEPKSNAIYIRSEQRPLLRSI